MSDNDNEKEKNWKDQSNMKEDFSLMEKSLTYFQSQYNNNENSSIFNL